MKDYAVYSDVDLVSLMKEDDAMAFNELYNRYWRILLNIAFQRLKSREESEELVQDLFISFFIRRNEIDISVSVEAYFRSALKYRIYNLFRSQQVKLVYEREAQVDNQRPPVTPQEQIELTELRNKIYHIAGQMPEKCRKVFLLSRFEQLSQKEIAQRLNISVSTVQKHMSKALTILRQEFKDTQFGFVAICFLVYLRF